MKLEHYEMVTNAPIFNTITSLSGSYAGQFQRSWPIHNKVSELGAYNPDRALKNTQLESKTFDPITKLLNWGVTPDPPRGYPASDRAAAAQLADPLTKLSNWGSFTEH